MLEFCDLGPLLRNSDAVLLEFTKAGRSCMGTGFDGTGRKLVVRLRGSEGACPPTVTADTAPLWLALLLFESQPPKLLRLLFTLVVFVTASLDDG
jgi:hypothetical protein